MPLELGIFVGAKRYGGATQRDKKCLILERDRYRYQVYCSDLAGLDIRAHQNDVSRALLALRNWLQASRTNISLPSAQLLERHYLQFRLDLPRMCRRAKIHAPALTFLDYRALVTGWVEENILVDP